jgi:hypothetical protein
MSGSVKKIEKLLEAGLDPNFTTDDKSMTCIYNFVMTWG